MRLDHVSYVASHDQISDVVNRIGSQIGTAFVDGGIHPKFGTRNFTAPLLNGQYIEVVCPLDHPATETTPFGIAVRKKATEGGGWLTWVMSTEKISEIENQLGRKAITGLRIKPNGSELKWKQIGVIESIEDREKPFFIEWIAGEHPSMDGVPAAKISKIIISGDSQIISNMFNKPILEISPLLEISANKAETEDFQNGIMSVNFFINGTTISIS
jgi:hypothetical protein